MFNKFQHIIRDTNQWSLLTVAIGLFVSIPIFAILIYLFSGVGEMWEHIVKHFLVDYIQNSLHLLVGTGILTVLFGGSTAWIVSNYDFPFRKWLDAMLFFPLAIPSYIVAYAYVGLFGNGGTIIRLLQAFGCSIQKIEFMNIYGLIWVLSCSLFPYVYASTRAMFLSFPKEIREASHLMGISNQRYFFSIALPLASPAIIGGLFLVFMEVLNDYGAAKYYGINTFTTGIFRSWTMLEDLQSAIYLSALLVVLVFAITGLVRWQRGKKSYAFRSITSAPNAQKKQTLYGRQKIGALIIILLPILFGFVLPLLQLIYWAVLTFDSMFNMELLWVTIDSILLALSATLFIIIMALALIFFSRWNALRPLHIVKKLGTIGYVIPGAIIGIGIIRSSQAIINFFKDTFNIEIGYWFYGSSIILIYAYVFRFLAVAFNPLDANSLKLSKHLAESSYLLGKGKLSTLFRIELPLLKNALMGTIIIVCIDILKELPLTLILKPYHLQTLAVKAYAYADDERVAEAALPALSLIILIGLLMGIVNIINSKWLSPSSKTESKAS